MKVSIVIPTLNEETYIPMLLKRLSDQSYKNVEIIVVDGFSGDRTKQKVSKFDCVKLIQCKKGTGRQRNRGALKARGDLLIFLDSDVFPEKTFVENIVVYFRKMEELGIACPVYVPYESTMGVKSIYSFFNFLFFLGEKHFPSGAGSCIVVRKNIFKSIGGFREDLIYDDIEFIRRTAKKFKFKRLNEKIYVSDRRFREHGAFSMLLLYISLSAFFVTNKFKTAELIKYSFGNHKRYEDI